MGDPGSPPFRKIALALIKQGIPVIRLKRRSKVAFDGGWQNLATTDPNVIEEWAREDPICNVGCVAKADGFWIFDVDCSEVNKRIRRETGHSAEKLTRTVQTLKGGWHLYFRQNDASRALGNCAETSKDAASEGKELWSARVVNRYVVAAGSYVVEQKDGKPSMSGQYETIDKRPIVEAPEWLIAWLEANRDKAQKTTAPPAGAVLDGQTIRNPKRHDHLLRLAGSMRAHGATESAIEAALLAENASRCDPPKPEEEVRRIARDIGKKSAGIGNVRQLGTDQNDSAATKLIHLAETMKLFHDAMGEAFATVSANGHLENMWINSRTFRHRLSLEFYRAEGKAPPPHSLQSAVHTIEAQALFDGREVEIHTRVAERDGEIYLDLCNADWEAVRITRSGWEVVPISEVKFVRYPGMLPLPKPIHGGSINMVDRFTNLSGPALSLFKGYQLGCLREKIPFPILAIIGEQDSGKTTLSRLLKSLIDPAKPLTRRAPKNEEDLMIAAEACHILALDNLSHIDQQLSDALCRLATGAGLGTRTLFTNRDQSIFSAVRPVVLNSIANVLSASDLVDRSLVLEPEPLDKTQKKPEEEYWAEFQGAHPAILGALCHAASSALSETSKPERKPDIRMLDFGLFVTRGERALGLKRGSFIRACEGNRRDANQSMLDLSLIGQSLERFLKDSEEWEGSFTELLSLLTPLVPSQTAASREWPKGPRKLSGEVRRLVPNLRRVGIRVDLGKREPGSGRSLVRLKRFAREPSQSSEPSQEESSVTRESVENKQDAGPDAESCEDVKVMNDTESFSNQEKIGMETEWEV